MNQYEKQALKEYLEKLQRDLESQARRLDALEVRVDGLQLEEIATKPAAADVAATTSAE